MSVEKFLADAGDREHELRAIDNLIRQTVPKMAADRQLMPGMTKSMLVYGMYHYKYASGREGDWAAVALAAQKHYISLYICAVDKDAYLAEKYGSRLGDVDTGKSCIRFKKMEDLNLMEVANILRETEAWWRDQPKPGVQ